MQDLLSGEDLEDLLSHLFGSENDEVDIEEFISAMMTRMQNNEGVPLVDESSR